MGDAIVSAFIHSPFTSLLSRKSDMISTLQVDD